MHKRIPVLHPTYQDKMSGSLFKVQTHRTKAFQVDKTAMIVTIYGQARSSLCFVAGGPTSVTSGFVMPSIFERLSEKLRDQQVNFDVLEHEAVYTSEEAARVRGTSLSSGAKALICKADGSLVMFVMPADRRLASKEIRKQLGIKSLRFASREEVLELTGLTPGSIPPFGSLFGLRTYCDQGLKNEPVINFNAGDHCVSISMAYNDFYHVEQPQVGTFSEP